MDALTHQPRKIGFPNMACLIALFCAAMAIASPAQTLTTLYSFCSQPNCADGELPYFAALIQASDGNLYGTTPQGGANSAGTVFKITPGGRLTTLYSFNNGPDGGYPYGALVQGTDGNFYGAASFGGTYGGGTLFRITPGGTLSTLHVFDFQDGAYPEGLVQGSDGNLYGIAAGGEFGTNCSGGGCGTVFKITLKRVCTT